MLTDNSFDFFIQWHLTERCNLRCRHCYQSGRRTDELTLPEIKNVIDEVSSTLSEWSETHNISFSPSFNLTGGEPFLRKDFFEVIEEIGNRGFDMYILSNGTLITGRIADMIAGHGVKGVQVSVEGPEEVHDSIRGKGSFSASSQGIRNLLDSGLNVTLNVTLSDLNAPYMKDMISITSSLGAGRLGFSRIVPYGRGLELRDHMLRSQEVKELYESLLSAEIDGIEIVTGDPVATQMNLPSGNDTGCTAFGGCAAGISGVTLLADGTITPCRRLDIPIGNIRKDSLREVWATSEVLESLRDKSRYKGKCSTCSRWANCRGCRAIAYAYTKAGGEGDYLAEDPQCFIESSQRVMTS
jgi:radical SAM protein with 4Fe4S-binding SPASM domain